MENALAVWRAYLVYLCHCVDWTGEGGSEGQENGNGVPTVGRQLGRVRAVAQQAIQMLRNSEFIRGIVTIQS